MTTLFFRIIFLFQILIVFGQENTVQIDKNFDRMLSKLLTHSVTEVHPELIKENHIYLDAREEEEFEVSHIPNAIHVGYTNFDMSNWLYLERTTPIIIYCSVGYRSEKIGEQFLKQGFTNVNNLYGGIFEWKHQNKPLVKNNHFTDSVHTYNKDWSKWLKSGIKIY